MRKSRSGVAKIPISKQGELCFWLGMSALRENRHLFGVTYIANVVETRHYVWPSQV